MFTALAAQNWAMFVLRGVLALALGVLAFAAPGPTLAALIFVFAFYAIFDGILATALGLASPTGPRWLLVVGGIVGIAIGVYTFVSPQVTAVALVLLIGSFAIVRGVAEVGDRDLVPHLHPERMAVRPQRRGVDRVRRVSDRRPGRRRPRRPLCDRVLRPVRRCHVRRDRVSGFATLNKKLHAASTDAPALPPDRTAPGIEPTADQKGDSKWTSRRSSTTWSSASTSSRLRWRLPRKENHEQLQQRIATAQAETDRALDEAKQEATAAADEAQSSWEQTRADAKARLDALKAKAQRRADQVDADFAASDADWAEADAYAAIDYADWAVENARLAILDAIDARVFADERRQRSSSGEREAGLGRRPGPASCLIR